MEEASTPQDENVLEWSRCLRWSAAGHGWFATAKDGTLICVSEETYERSLCAYLKCIGIERKAWVQIMRSAQEEWARQREAEQLFQSNLEQWLTSDCPGVQIISGEETF